MIFEALEPLHITTKSLGEVSLAAGDRLDWPDQAVKMLLAQYPESVRVVENLPFQVHDLVSFRIPDPQSTNTRPEWQTHTGIIQAIDPRFQMAFIVTEKGPGPEWVWVWWGYCRKVADDQA